ncbi:MAG TPA: response regulator transcription factor [Vicinamibacterales bacterium]|nr:response regulator transcription factor [Vicinamibacterales bacterium]
MSNPHSIRVLCVDDHRIVREGLALIIGRQPDMEVVGSASSGEEAVELFTKFRPDITLMDLNLRGMSGLDAIRTIRKQDPRARVVVLTMHNGEEYIHRALEAGAASYVLKDTLSDNLVGTIRDVHEGRRTLAPDVEARLAERAGNAHLTPREVQVVELISQGMRNKEIAATLGISFETAQVHVKNILAKLKVQDRTAAVSVAVRRGIIQLQ